jgi:hypothetical protein
MTIWDNLFVLKKHHVGIAPTSKQENGYLVCISTSSHTSSSLPRNTDTKHRNKNIPPSEIFLKKRNAMMMQ